MRGVEERRRPGRRMKPRDLRLKLRTLVGEPQPVVDQSTYEGQPVVRVELVDAADPKRPQLLTLSVQGAKRLLSALGGALAEQGGT
jgi:hypothetical protein